MGVPYARQLAGAATVDADIQTDDVTFSNKNKQTEKCIFFEHNACFTKHFFKICCNKVGFMSCREICVCEKVFHGVADSEILISLINEQIIVIRVLIDDLEYPLYHCVMLDQIKFPLDDETNDDEQLAITNSESPTHSDKYKSPRGGSGPRDVAMVTETVSLSEYIFT